MEMQTGSLRSIKRRLGRDLAKGLIHILFPLTQLPLVRRLRKLLQFFLRPLFGIVHVALAALRALFHTAALANWAPDQRQRMAITDRSIRLGRQNIGLTADQHGRQQEQLSLAEPILTTFKTQTMNEQNFEYLKKQLKHTGYGEELAKDLREELNKQSPAFTLYHQADYGKDNVVAALHFRKSDSTDMVFFNRHTIMLKNEKHPDPIRQTFYIDNGKDNVTLKEGYNLLSGRAVEKNLETKEGEKYRAWLQLNFKETDKHGNYITKQFHEKYGFDLERSLLQLPLKLDNPEQKQRLMESLQRGNRQSVTLEIEGKERKIFVEAAPQFKSLNYYSDQGKRLQLQSVLQHPERAFGEKQTEKETKTQKVGKEDDLEDKPKKKQTKRQTVS